MRRFRMLVDQGNASALQDWLCYQKFVGKKIRSGEIAIEFVDDLPPNFAWVMVENSGRISWYMAAKSWNAHRTMALQFMFVELAKQIENRSLSFFCYLGDGVTAGRDIPPCLAFSSARPQDLLIPDPHFLQTSGYKEDRTLIDDHSPDWGDRLEQAFWRGGLNTKERLDFLVTSQSWKNADVGYTNVENNMASSLSEMDEALQASLIGNRVPISAFANSKIVFDVDGHGASWRGTFTRVRTHKKDS